VKVTLKSVGNEGHFTPDTDAVSRHVPSHCGVVTEIFHMVLAAHALQAVKG
jgi:hypothetical protein